MSSRDVIPQPRCGSQTNHFCIYFYTLTEMKSKFYFYEYMVTTKSSAMYVPPAYT